jgi:protein SCO1
LKRKLPLLAGALLIVIAAAGAVVTHPWWGSGQTDQSVGAVDIGGPFTLTAPDGHSVSDSDFRGKWMLVYFGYTNCPDACPTALNSLANALEMMKGRRSTVAPIFITVDPARDTPSVMGHYVGLFDKQIIGLTGTEAQIEKVEHEYRVYAARHPNKNGDYSMDHSSIIYVMDKNGRFNSVIDGAANPEDIAAKIEKLDS